MSADLNLSTCAAALRDLDGCVIRKAEVTFSPPTFLIEAEHWDGHSLSVICSDMVLLNISAGPEQLPDTEIVRTRIQAVADPVNHLNRMGYLLQFADPTTLSERSLYQVESARSRLSLLLRM